MQVVALGSITVDIVVSGMPAELTRGDKQEVSAIELYPGGGAVNATAGFRDQGAQVRLLGSVGQDALGERLRHHLHSLGVDTSAVGICAGEQTGKAVVLVGPCGSASVLARRGANSALRFSAPDLLADLLYAAPLAAPAMDSLAQALVQSHRRPACLMINPSVASVQRQDEAFRQVCARADMLGLNAVEAQMLAGLAPADIQADLDIVRAGELAQRLQCHPRQGVLITLGAQGAVLALGGERYFEPARQVAVRSTVGAGDAFNSRFALAWCQRRDPVHALRQATQAAADVLGQWAGNFFPPLWQEGPRGLA